MKKLSITREGAAEPAMDNHLCAAAYLQTGGQTWGPLTLPRRIKRPYVDVRFSINAITISRYGANTPKSEAFHRGYTKSYPNKCYMICQWAPTSWGKQIKGKNWVLFSVRHVLWTFREIVLWYHIAHIFKEEI